MLAPTLTGGMLAHRPMPGAPRSPQLQLTQPRVKKLLCVCLRHVAVYSGKSFRLLRPIGLNNLARNGFLSSKDGCRRSMLAVHDCETASLNRSDDHRRELRPVEILGDELHMSGSTTPDISLIHWIDDKLLDLDPQQLWRRAGRNSDKGVSNRLVVSERNIGVLQVLACMIARSTRIVGSDKGASYPLANKHPDSPLRRPLQDASWQAISSRIFDLMIPSSDISSQIRLSPMSGNRVRRVCLV
jgi:hypothetical protein